LAVCFVPGGLPGLAAPQNRGMASWRLSAPFLAACATAVLATACGIPGPSSGCLVSACATSTSTSAPSPSASAATAEAHGWTTTASVSSGKIQVRVTVVGPLSVEAGCSPALAAWIARLDGTKIEPSPDPGVRCQAIVIDDIAAGQTRDYSVVIPAPPPGTYTVHGLVRVHLPLGAGARVAENIPVVTLTIS
jgi:hypothetical protein